MDQFEHKEKWEYSVCMFVGGIIGLLIGMSVGFLYIRSFIFIGIIGGVIVCFLKNQSIENFNSSVDNIPVPNLNSNDIYDVCYALGGMASIVSLTKRSRIEVAVFIELDKGTSSILINQTKDGKNFRNNPNNLAMDLKNYNFSNSKKDMLDKVDQLLVTLPFEEEGDYLKISFNKTSSENKIKQRLLEGTSYWIPVDFNTPGSSHALRICSTNATTIMVDLIVDYDD